MGCSTSRHVCAYVPWEVEPLLLQVGVESLHDLVKELHTTLQPLVQVGHLGGFQNLHRWVKQQEVGGGAVGGAIGNAGESKAQ